MSEILRKLNIWLTYKKGYSDTPQEAADLDAMVTSFKSHNDNLVDQVHELEISSARLQEKVTAYENCMGGKFYPHLLTTIDGRRWLLTYDVKLAIVKCLHSPEYLSALGAAISRAIEKGMQDGLAAGITHGQEGRVLTDIAAINPSAEIDYISALQELQDVNFSLLAELKSNKDASTETLMNILHLDEPLIKRLGLDESQPYVDQLLSPSIIRRTELSLVPPPYYFPWIFPVTKFKKSGTILLIIAPFLLAKDDYVVLCRRSWLISKASCFVPDPLPLVLIVGMPISYGIMALPPFHMLMRRGVSLLILSLCGVFHLLPIGHEGVLPSSSCFLLPTLLLFLYSSCGLLFLRAH
ncbi:hypothetical protein Tco_1216409 [Tanacetum coccineum]